MATAELTTERLLFPEDLAALFRVRVSTIGAWAREGKLPAPIKIGGRSSRPFWTAESIERFLRQQASPAEASLAPAADPAAA